MLHGHSFIFACNHTQHTRGITNVLHNDSQNVCIFTLTNDCCVTTVQSQSILAALHSEPIATLMSGPKVVFGAALVKVAIQIPDSFLHVLIFGGVVVFVEPAQGVALSQEHLVLVAPEAAQPGRHAVHQLDGMQRTVTQDVCRSSHCQR